MSEYWEVYNWEIRNGHPTVILDHLVCAYDPRQDGWTPNENVEIAHIQGDKTTWLQS